MGNFISNLIARHTNGGNYVMPRMRGRFEPQAAPVQETAPGYFPGSTPADASAPQPEQSAGQPAAGPPSLHQPSPAAVRAAHIISRYQPSLLRTAPAGDAAESGNAHPVQPPVQAPAGLPQEQPLNAIHPAVVHHSLVLPGTVNNIDNPYADREHPAPGPTQHTGNRSVYFSADPSAKDGPVFPYTGLQPPATLLKTGQQLQAPGRPAGRMERNAPASADQQPRPVIKVTIGRVDVRAMQQPAAAKNGNAAKTAMSLDDFLKKRSGGTS
jgi:hypothetical protein